MVEEFVDKLGGGLVVVSGPRFGPGQLAQTRLADMLPVKVDPSLRIRDRQPFALRRTAEAAQYDFMRLAHECRGEREAWNNLGPLALVPAGGAAAPVGHRPGRAPHGQVRGREDPAAAGGRPALRARRGGVHGLQRDVAAPPRATATATTGSSGGR